MGHTASSLLLCRRQPQLRILIFGLDAAGKTSLLYQLKTGELLTTIPTIGFNVETIVMEGLATLTMWDIGGRDKIRPLFRHYFSGTHGVLFAIDSNDRERLPEAIEELNWIGESLTSDGLPDVPIAVLCNKCDLPGDAVADTIAEVQKILSDETSLSKLPGLSTRSCSSFAVSASTGEGLSDAVKWLILAAQNKSPQSPKAETAKAIAISGKVESAKSETTGWSGLYHLVKSALLR